LFAVSQSSGWRDWLRVISSTFWILTAVGFVASSLGCLGILETEQWRRPSAVVLAGVSLPGLILVWNTWPAFNTVGALAMNVAVLATQLWFHWPPTGMFGR